MSNFKNMNEGAGRERRHVTKDCYCMSVFVYQKQGYILIRDFTGVEHGSENGAH